MLDTISFGDRVAENESDNLSTYFIETQSWKLLFSGDVDVVFGAKGAGKSALYTLLLQKEEELMDKGICLLSAEKPTGKTVFSDVTNQPPTSENEFVTLWKIYFCQLIVSWLKDKDMCDSKAKIVSEKLIDAGLIEEKNTLKRLVNSAMNFARNLTKLESLEGGVTLEGGVNGKITFKTPTQQQLKDGYLSVDDLLEMLNEHLEKHDKKCWILCDRLDVAFDESINLEKNALRALFKAYRDIEEYKSISIKVFLRDDIWARITKDGFREASHITKSTTIKWNSRNLLNLIISRALNNQGVIDKYAVNKEEILSDHTLQKEVYYKLFPLQVDVGSRQSDTFDWILSRVRDGKNNTAPRELIHYYNETVACEISEQEISNNKIDEPNIVSRLAIKNAAYEVSRVRMEQTIFAEYPEMKDFMSAFENKKAEHNLSSLSKIWALSDDKALQKANELADIGFFEFKAAKTEKIYKIPFIYRGYLSVTQGKAY
jgi:hypothetical protein